MELTARVQQDSLLTNCEELLTSDESYIRRRTPTSAVPSAQCWICQANAALLERVFGDARATAACVLDPRCPDGPLVHVAPAFEEATGYAADFALGRSARFVEVGSAPAPHFILK